MARIRTIKPEFFTSLDITRHDVLTRLLYVGLWTHCDDYGRCIYDPRLIKAALFPLDDDITPEILRKALESLHDAFQVMIYDHGGRAYLQVVAWEDHQRVSHPGKDKLPAYDDSGSILRQSSGDSLETLVPEQGTGNREQGTASVTPPRTKPDDGFDAFWKMYPKKVDRKDAVTKWRNLSAKDRAAAMEALPTHARSWQGVDKQYIKNPSTWLNKRSWENELSTNANTPAPRADGLIVTNSV